MRVPHNIISVSATHWDAFAENAFVLSNNKSHKNINIRALALLIQMLFYVRAQREVSYIKIGA